MYSKSEEEAVNNMGNDMGQKFEWIKDDLNKRARATAIATTNTVKLEFKAKPENGVRVKPSSTTATSWHHHRPEARGLEAALPRRQLRGPLHQRPPAARLHRDRKGQDESAGLGSSTGSTLTETRSRSRRR